MSYKEQYETFKHDNPFFEHTYVEWLEIMLAQSEDDSHQQYLSRYHRQDIDTEIEDIQRAINFIVLKVKEQRLEDSTAYMMWQMLITIRDRYHSDFNKT